MREILSKFIPLLFMSLTLVGCGVDSNKPAKPFRAQVIDYVPASSLRAESFSIVTRELAMLEDIDSLRGTYFSVNLGGVINIKSNVGSLVSAQLASTTNTSKLRYITKDGVIIPRDTSSLLAISSFHAFERTLSTLKLSTGVEPQALKEKNNGSFNIYFEPSLVEPETSGQSFFTLKFNAAFNPENNQFYLFRRSEIETVPFSANLKVISHEFGHALFKTSFHQNKSEACSSDALSEIKARREDKFFAGRWNLEYAISGLNEGFADFHSHVVTTSTDVFAELTPALTNSSRSLTGEKFKFSQLGNDRVCAGRFYCIGTLFARSLYNIGKQYANNRDELMAYSRRVYLALERTQDLMRTTPAKDILPFPTQDVATCMRRDKPVLAYDGAVTSGFLAAFLQSFEAQAERKMLCDNFAELFGTEGFSETARVVCDL